MNLFNDPLFKALFENAVPRVLFKADMPEFTITHYNKAYELATNTQGRNLRGMSVWDYYKPELSGGESADLLLDALSRAVRDQTNVYMQPFRYDIPGNTEGEMVLNWWELEVVYIPARESDPPYLLTTITNMTRHMIDQQAIADGIIREQQMVEEIVAMNEDLSSANEQLASTNEELTVVNEELHASNDEIIHVNDELSAANEQLSMMYDELMHSQLSLKTLYAEMEKRVEQRTAELRENELQFRLMADAIIQLIWITDHTGKPLYYNKRFLDFAGKPDGNIGGEDWKRIFHPDDDEKAKVVWTKSLETGEPYEIEFRLQNLKGEYVWMLGRAAPLYDQNGNITKWFGTCTDINEMKLSDQRKDDFISIASHELKTPVTSLKASLQLLEKLQQTNSAHDIIPALIEQACRSSSRVSSLIEDLLNVSRLNTGQLPLNKTKFKLSKVIEECCSHIRLAGIYTIYIRGEKNLEVYADASRIDQVVINFLNNAIKYASGSKEINIVIKTVEDSAVVMVMDEGPGIPQEKLPHLFERYYRSDVDGGLFSGLGLGLYISSEIIKRHDGQIGVTSEIGKGSTFWFALPIRSSHSVGN